MTYREAIENGWIEKGTAWSGKNWKGYKGYSHYDRPIKAAGGSRKGQFFAISASRSYYTRHYVSPPAQ